MARLTRMNRDQRENRQVPEVCAIDDCAAPVVARGWCRKHYGRWHRHGDPLHERVARTCSVPGCDGPHRGGGLCLMHYARLRTTGSLALRTDPRRRDRRVGTDRRNCATCEETKSVAEFFADPARWDGFRPDCKACLKVARDRRMTPERIEERKARVRARRGANIEAEREKRRRAYAANPSQGRSYTQQRRAQKRAAPCEDFIDQEIFERDGWRCGLCGDPIPQDGRWPDPQSASLDHVLPLARGGHHTRANVQASHLFCNLSKKDSLVAVLGQRVGGHEA